MGRVRRMSRREWHLEAELGAAEAALGALHGLASKVLPALPHQLKHKVMVPVAGRAALLPATLHRSNEVLVDLGGGMFAWRSASQALEVTQRRIRRATQQRDRIRQLLEAEAEKAQEIAAIKAQLAEAEAAKKQADDMAKNANGAAANATAAPKK